MPPTVSNLSRPPSVIWVIIKPTSSIWALSISFTGARFPPDLKAIILPSGDISILSAKGVISSNIIFLTVSSSPDTPSARQSFLSISKLCNQKSPFIYSAISSAVFSISRKSITSAGVCIYLKGMETMPVGTPDLTTAILSELVPVEPPITSRL